MDPDAEDTDGLYDSVALLVKEFEKILGKIKQHNNKSAPAVTAAHGLVGKASSTSRQQQQQQQQQQCRGDSIVAPSGAPAGTVNCPCEKGGGGTYSRLNIPTLQHQQMQQQQQPISTNESNYGQRVCTEPSELKLVLKLDTWISENGSLVVKPSVYEDRGDTTANNNSGRLPTTLLASVNQACCSGNSEEEELLARPTAPPPLAAPVVVPPPANKSGGGGGIRASEKRFRALNNSVQAIAKQLGAIQGGGGSVMPHEKSGGRRAVVGSLTGGGGGGGGVGSSSRLTTKRGRVDSSAYAASTAYHNSGGDSGQTNNHHDSVSDHMSDHSDANSITSGDSYRVGDAPSNVAALQDPTSRALLQRLQNLIESDHTAPVYH